MTSRTNQKTKGYCPDICPDFNTCQVPVTRDAFQRICSTKGFIKCYHFSKRQKMLKTPTNWMTSIATTESVAMKEYIESLGISDQL